MWFATLASAEPLPPTLVPDEVVDVVTRDGWTEHLRRYRADGPPVLLVHGMAANHYNWDFRPEVSLAHALQARGYDVWIADLRGDPGTEAPGRREARRIDFDRYATGDVPALVHAVLDRTGADQLYWVGHSLGGMLLYAWLAQEPSTVAGGVTICSPSTFVAYEPSKTVKQWSWVARGKGVVPTRVLAELAAPLGKSNPFWDRLSNPDNLDWDVALGLSRVALSDLPRPLATQALGWVEADALLRRDGSPWIAPVGVPLLVLGAAGDHVVAEPDVAATCATYPDCTYHRLGLEDGFSADYGHIDAVLGKAARAEVYPLVLDWLDGRRAGTGAEEAHPGP